jgi:hypothetical protein
MRKWKAHWWGSRTSNPVYRAKTLVGGFDSHALPPQLFRYVRPLSQESGLFFLGDRVGRVPTSPLFATSTRQANILLGFTRIFH